MYFQSILYFAFFILNELLWNASFRRTKESNGGVYIFFWKKGTMAYGNFTQFLFGMSTMCRCHIFQSPIYQTSGYPFISVVMYAVHAAIVLPRSRFTPLKSMGEERSEMWDSQILYASIKSPTFYKWQQIEWRNISSRPSKLNIAHHIDIHWSLHSKGLRYR